MWPLRGGLSGQNHCLVVMTVAPETVTVLDPLVGERAIPQVDFSGRMGGDALPGHCDQYINRNAE